VKQSTRLGEIKRAFHAPPPARRSPLLQRKCACGGACAGCRAESLPRETRSLPFANPAARPRLEPERRGHSFGRVSVRAPAVLREENLDWQTEQGGGDAEARPLDAPQPADGTPAQRAPILPGVQTGGTNCDAASGTAIAKTSNNDPCTKDCSEQHEAKHVADIGPCCAKAGAAHKNAQTQEEKDAVQKKFNDWMLTNESFLECRAYDVSIKCGQAKAKALKCAENVYNSKCCGPINRYVTSAIRQKEATCNNAGSKLTDCPFT